MTEERLGAYQGSKKVKKHVEVSKTDMTCHMCNKGPLWVSDTGIRFCRACGWVEK